MSKEEKDSQTIIYEVIYLQLQEKFLSHFNFEFTEEQLEALSKFAIEIARVAINSLEIEVVKRNKQ